MRACLPLLCCVVAGCSDRGGSTATTPRPADAVPPAAAATALEVQAPAAATVDGRRRGVPHRGAIVGVVVDGAGTRALSRDALGGVRVWPALDGSREPQVVPVRAPEAMAIGARADGSLAALIDAAGVATVLRLDEDGLVRAAATLSPDVPLAGVVVLGGGERVLAVRSDQRLLLLDEDGAERARLAVQGARVIAVHAIDGGAVAVLRRGGDGGGAFEVRRLAAGGDALAWSGAAQALAAPVATLPHAATAVSPDGAVLAYVASGKGGPEVRVVEVATGAAIALDGAATIAQPEHTTIGFTGARRIEVGALGAAGWRIDVDGRAATVLAAAMTATTASPAYAPGRRVGAYQASLTLRDDDGDLRYLGHRELYPTGGAVSARGDQVAWVTSTGALVVQRLDGRADLRVKGADDWFGSAAWVGDDHVLVGRNDGRLALIDARDGAERGAIVAAASVPVARYEPATGLAAVLRDAGVVWVIAVDPAAAEPFGAPIAVADGAVGFALLDPARAGGAALLTIDGQQRARRYTLDELRDGLSAAEMKAERVASDVNAWAIDGAGRSYRIAGSSIEVRDGATAVATIAVDQPVHAVFPAPSGDRLAALVSSAGGLTAVRGVDGSGAPLWTFAPPRGLLAITWSGDGARALLQTQGTALLIDAATGAPLATGEGWAFGLTHELPTAHPLGLESGF